MSREMIGLAANRVWGLLCFPVCFVCVFFMAGAVFGWGTAYDQLRWHWTGKRSWEK